MTAANGSIEACPVSPFARTPAGLGDGVSVKEKGNCALQTSSYPGLVQDRSFRSVRSNFITKRVLAAREESGWVPGSARDSPHTPAFVMRAAAARWLCREPKLRLSGAKGARSPLPGE